MNQLLARSLVFSTSASVLVIEILAARLVAPYLGVSLEVFTGIIGVILAGISLGAWLGGSAADRGNPSRLPGPLLVAGGVTALASPLIIDAIGPALDVDAGSTVFAAAAAFFAPAAVLSAVPPIVVKIQLDTLDETGRIVGSYSAVGTAGALFGTFVTGFVLIAAFPTRPIIAVLGIALTTSGLVMWVTRRSWAVLSATFGGLLATALLGLSGPCEHETAYHCAIVQVDESRPSGRVLLLDRMRNSYVDLDDPTHLEIRYIELMADVIESEAPPGAVDVVSIGGGGFTMPGYFGHTRPGSRNTVLEIDPELVRIGTNELALGEDVEVVVADARISLRDIPSGRAEIVIGDAYSGASVPWHLTTVEFTEEIERVLSPDGVYTMNVIDYGDLDFVRAEASTMRAVFANVAVFAPPEYLEGRAGGNFVVVAAHHAFDLLGIEARIRNRGGTEHGVVGSELDTFIDGAQTLTDDYAPVDQMLGSP